MTTISTLFFATSLLLAWRVMFVSADFSPFYNHKIPSWSSSEHDGNPQPDEDAAVRHLKELKQETAALLSSSSWSSKQVTTPRRNLNEENTNNNDGSSMDFALVRLSIGTPASSSSDLFLASVVSMNGELFEYTTTTDATTETTTKVLGDTAIGSFVSTCTVTSMTDSEMLCHYELIFHNTDGSYGMGSVLANGRVVGTTNRHIVTASQLDFSEYSIGTMMTEMDPSSDKPVLYASLQLHN